MEKCPFVNMDDYSVIPSCAKNGTICSFVRRCGDKRIWLPLNGMDSCKLRKPPIPDGAYRVLFRKNDKLFVTVGKFTYEIEYGEKDTPEYVFLEKADDGYKIIKEV